MPMARRSRWLDIVLAGFAIVSFSSTYTLIKIALAQLPPITVGALRFLLCSAFVIPFALSKYRSKLFIGHSKRAWFDFFIVSLTVIALPNLFQNIGLQYTSASVAVVIQSTVPIFSALFAVVLLSEKVGWRRWVGGVVSLVGVVFLSTNGNPIGSLASASFYGNFLQVATTVVYAIGSIYLKKRLETYKPILLVTMSFVLGAIILTITAIPFESSKWTLNLDSSTVFAMLLLSLLYSAGLFCWYWVLEHVTVSGLYYSLFLLPILGIIIAVLTLHESFGAQDLIYAVVILAGLGIAELSSVSSNVVPSVKKK